MAAGFTGALGAGPLYGLEPIFATLVVLFVLALVTVWFLVEALDTRIERWPSST